MSNTSINRRQFIIQGTAAVSAVALSASRVQGAPAIIRNLSKPDSKFGGVQIGAISYSFRSLPCDAEQLLKYCLDANISAIELMGNTAEAFAGAPHASTAPQGPWNPRERTPEEQAEQKRKDDEMAAWRAKAGEAKFVQLRKMYNQAGVSIYAWKPGALGEKNTDAEIAYALRMARALGASHVTVEIPANSAQSARLGKLADIHKVGVGYHGHLQQTPTAWDDALAQARYNGLNLDIGHYVAAGFDPVPLITAKHERLYSMHVKDRKSKDNGGENMPWGEGDTPIVAVLEVMKKNKYKFPATVELEYPIPDGSDAVKEVARCVEYCRKVLEKTS